jgi:hypothetical protein
MKSPIFILAALCAIGAVLGQDAIDITVPGQPMVDGPMPHRRFAYRELELARPSIAGHRGNCGEFPEHSMIAYASAIAHGADFVECDVVVSGMDLRTGSQRLRVPPAASSNLPLPHTTFWLADDEGRCLDLPS